MPTILAVIALLSLPTYFCVRYVRDYVEPFSTKMWGFSERLALVTLIGYLILVGYYGLDGLLAFQSTRRESEKLLTFIVGPCVGFAFTLFPKVAAEFFDIVVEVLLNRINVPAIIGWALILHTGLVMVI